MIVLSDTAFHAPVCPRSEWQNRLLVESVLVMLTLVMPFKKVVPPVLGVFPRPPRVHHGRLQCAGPVAWVTAHRVGLRAPLDRGIEFVENCYGSPT
jgi:hypothetical protein